MKLRRSEALDSITRSWGGIPALYGSIPDPSPTHRSNPFVPGRGIYELGVVRGRIGGGGGERYGLLCGSSVLCLKGDTDTWHWSRSDTVVGGVPFLVCVAYHQRAVQKSRSVSHRRA